MDEFDRLRAASHALDTIREVATQLEALRDDLLRDLHRRDGRQWKSVYLQRATGLPPATYYRIVSRARPDVADPEVWAAQVEFRGRFENALVRADTAATAADADPAHVLDPRELL